MFEARGLLTPAGQALAAAASAAGASPVLVARDGVVIGAIGVADQPREVAADTIELLRRQGLRPIVMLTGDHRGAAEAVAKLLKVDEVHAGLLPEEKVAVIRSAAEAPRQRGDGRRRRQRRAGPGDRGRRDCDGRHRQRCGARDR